MRPTRRALILPVVLFILLLVGLLGAMFAFRVHADVASLHTMTYRLQTRLAAEAGIERVKLLLRNGRNDRAVWYNNPKELHRVIVWGYDLPPEQWGTTDEYGEGAMIYRFSIVADDPTNDQDFVRFGITDEAAKLNLNQATPDQLLKLVRAAVGDSTEIVPEDIVDAIIDWRDPDSEPHGQATDTEGEYYLGLDTPYMIKNGPFDTVEELLLVKGVTGQILYGEDQDRNGLLTDNEDDGDRTFPPDNADNKLNRGLYPYLTVWSYENNVDNANRPRVNLLGDAEILRAKLEEAFPDEPNVVEFIVEATRTRTLAGDVGSDRSGGNAGRGDAASSPPDNTDNAEPESPQTDVRPEDRDQSDEKPPPEKGAQDPGDTGNTDTAAPENDQSNDGNQAEEENPADGQPGDTDATKEDGETDGVDKLSGPIRSPVFLMWERGVDGKPQPSPVTLEHLPVLLDKFTVLPPDQRRQEGLIDVNTAPRLVLACIEGLTDEQVSAILDTRGTLDPEARSTIAWLVTSGAVDLDTFDRIAPEITARGQQFMIESLGYADHVGMVTRLQVVVDMIGPIAQTLYYRDISQLGPGYPIREKDLERVVGR